jgi:hypothetical protein
MTKIRMYEVHWAEVAVKVVVAKDVTEAVAKTLKAEDTLTLQEITEVSLIAEED